MRKLVFGVSDLVRHKPGCAITECMARGLKISNLGSRGIVVSCSEKKASLFSQIMQKAGFLMTRLIFFHQNYSDIEFVGVCAH